jgi:hypothetical protein
MADWQTAGTRGEELAGEAVGCWGAPPRGEGGELRVCGVAVEARST